MSQKRLLKNNRIVVAMSGGVDSSVAAALLKKQGCFVIGIFMKFWKEGVGSENRCCSVESEKLARAVARKIGMPFYVVNVEREFKKKVVDYFLKEYKKGNTPNPCVVCNKEIKFGFLIKKALSLGADFVATGHYIINKKGKLFKGRDKSKDQSYFLWQLDQKQISRVLFPVGEYKKPEVRKLAKKFKLPTAETPESQEICFVQSTVNGFLKKYLKTKPGKIVDVNGKVLGQHNGLWFYTIGQRKGLDIPQGSASVKGSGETKPYFAVGKNFNKNALIVSKDIKDLEKKELIARDVNWIVPQKLPIKAHVKIRYKSELYPAIIHANKGGGVKVIFSNDPKGSPRAITPGQSVVFYKGEELIGGGVIE